MSHLGALRGLCESVRNLRNRLLKGFRLELLAPSLDQLVGLFGMKARFYCAALVACCLIACPSISLATNIDTVELVDGGRVRGTIMTQDPKKGVRVQLGDGTVVEVPAEKIAKVTYGDEKSPSAKSIAVSDGSNTSSENARISSTPSDASPWRLHLGADLGGMFGTSSGLRSSVYAGVFYSLSKSWELFGQAGTIAFFYSVKKDSPGLGTGTTTLGADGFSYNSSTRHGSGSLFGIDARVGAGYRLTDAFTIRAAALAGFAASRASTDFCGDVKGSGAVIGFGGEIVYRVVPRLEVGALFDLMTLPLASCEQRVRTDAPPETRNTPRTSDDNFHPVVSATLNYLF